MKTFKNYNSLTYLIALICIVVCLAYYRVNIQIGIGPIFDSYDFLANTMFFAGQSYGYTDLIRPPFLPFITSLIFRLGVVSEFVIFYVDALFLVIGTIGLYLFFRINFDAMESFLGSLLFSTFPLVLLFTGVGLSDVPSIALSIWALYTMVLAVKKNPKYFYLSFPLAMLAFLTRYPAGFIIFPIFFYLIVNREKISTRHMIVGVLLSLIPGIAVILFYYVQFGDPFYSLSSFYLTTQKVWDTTYVYYRPDPLYFLKNMLSYIGVGGITIVSLMIFSIFIFIITKYSIIESKIKALFKYLIEYAPKKEIILSLIILILFVLTFTKTHYLLSEVLFFFLILLTYNIINKSNIKDLDFDFVFISWLMSFFIFHSVYIIKDERYFITMAPAISYFLIFCFSGLKKLWGMKIKPKNLLYNALATVIMVMIIVSGVDYIHEIPDNESKSTDMLNNIKNASQWLKENDPQYRDKIIYSDKWPYFSWYLRTNVRQMPSFNTQESYEYQLNIEKGDYYLSVREELNLTNYLPIKHFGIITIYKRQ